MSPLSSGRRAPTITAARLHDGPLRSLPGRWVVPAADPRSFGFWLRHLLSPHGNRERVRRWLTLALPSRDPYLAPRLWHGEEGDGHLLPTAARAVAGLEASGALATAGLANGGPYPWVARCGSPARPSQRTVVLMLDRDGRAPLAVAKLQSGGSDDSLDSEWEALSRLRITLPAKLAATVPRPLARVAAAGVEGIVLSGGSGRALDVAVQTAWRPERLAARHLRAALEWLAAFQLATAAEAVASEARTRGGRSLPAVAGHGDYWSRNVLVSGHDVVTTVVDWEDFRPISSRFEDLFQLTVHWALRLGDATGRDRSEAFRLAFVADSPLAATFDAALAAWCRASGTDPALLRPELAAWIRRRAEGADVPRRRPMRWDACLEMVEGGAA